MTPASGALGEGDDSRSNPSGEHGIWVLVGGVHGSRLVKLGHDFLAIRNVHARALPNLPQISAEVVLELLDPDGLALCYTAKVATSSYFVKPRARSGRVRFPYNEWVVTVRSAEGQMSVPWRG